MMVNKHPFARGIDMLAFCADVLLFHFAGFTGLRLIEMS